MRYQSLQADCVPERIPAHGKGAGKDSAPHRRQAIVDFDEGEQTAVFAAVFEAVSERYNDSEAQWATKYQTASDTISSMESELDTLRQYKTSAEAAAAEERRNKIFAQFEDLEGIEAFAELRANCESYDPDVLEEKCYAIRGKHGTQLKFAAEPQKPPRLPVEHNAPAATPYNGVFEEFGIHALAQ